jgi:hypothetical protein
MYGNCECRHSGKRRLTVKTSVPEWTNEDPPMRTRPLDRAFAVSRQWRAMRRWLRALVLGSTIIAMAPARAADGEQTPPPQRTRRKPSSSRPHLRCASNS